MFFRHPTFLAFAAVAGVVALAGCSHGSTPTGKDQAATSDQLDIYQRNQPIPQANWSQYRQTLVDVEQAQIHGVATTSFFFNQGSTTPYKVCPSIGFPVASTSQLTNPDQVVYGGNQNSPATIGQLEPNGTYTGHSSGTYVACVAPDGTKYVSYAEGFVHTEGGPAHFDRSNSMIVADGAPTVTTQAGGK